MTTTSNIVLGVPAWQSSHSYIAGVLVANSSNAYLCIASGTSAISGGPTTTSVNITDGTAHWQYLCAINYTSLSSWAAGIPGTPTQPIVGLVLAGASVNIATPANTPYLSLTGHSTTPTNTITLMPFPGFGLNTIIGASTFGGSNTFSSDFSADFGSGVSLPQPGAFNSSAVNFLAPAVPVGSVNYFDITDANVIFDSLQFKDQGAASACTLIKTETAASNFIIRNCIIDGYAQPAGASILEISSQGLLDNSLVVDRQAAANTNPTIVLTAGNGSHFVNNTLVKINGESGGTTTAINWATTTGAIFRNNAVYGYGNPFGSGIGGSATADHNVGSTSTFVSSGLTVGAGNVVSTFAASQFINPTTDFRLLSTAACVHAGIADTTDIPTATDIVGHNRVVWDAGAFALFVVAFSATQVFPVIAVGSAAIGTSNVAHGAAAIQPISAIATFAKSLSAAAVLNINLAVRTISSSSNQASMANAEPWSSDFSLDFGPPDHWFMSLLASATAMVNIQASTAVPIEILSAVGFLNDAAVALGTVPPLVCIGGVTQGYGPGNEFCLATFATMVAAASMSSATTASGTAGIIFQPLMSAAQSDQASAAVNFAALADTASFGQIDLATAATAIYSLVATGAIGFSVSARVTLPMLTSVITATLAGQVTGRATLPPLTVPTPVRPQLQADPSAGGILLADGSGLILRADVPRPVSLAEATTSTGVATMPPVSCFAIAFASDITTVAVSVAAMAVTASLGQADQATGSGAVVLAAAGQATLQRAMNALATLASLQAVVAAGQSDPASSANTLSLVAVGAAQQVDQALSATNINLAVVATGGPTLIASAAVNLPPLAAVITMANVNGAHGSASIVLAVAGTLTRSTNASVADAVATMAVAASAMLTTPASATVAIPVLVAVAAAGQSDATAGSSAVVLRCAAVLNNASVNTAGLATVPPLVAAGTAQNFILSASTMASIRLGVAATASISGAQMAGSGTITISAASATGQANFAATLASLAVLAETNATLYVSPTEYETGDQVIYWPA